MAGRALRSLPLVQTWAELSTLDHPQWVNEDGFEVDEPLNPSDDGPEDGLTGVAEATEEVQADAMEVDEPEEVLVTPPDGDIEPKDPLLSMKDSQIFPYALLQTRQHHLQHLLPHIFSHPPIPSHNKPRARGPPKGTFLFPTPPPLVHPLPIPEYHAGRSAGSQQAGESSSTAAEGANSPASPSNSSPTVKQSKKVKDNQDGPPAHETDCIARVTLSIGPISFPSTELWVGRFVEPRAKAQKVRRPKGEAKERKRSLAEDAALRRAKAGSSFTGGTPLPYRPPATGTGPVPRPSLGASTPAVRPTADTPPGPATAGPPKTNISPALIQLVNQAAGRHPWLLTIIHKAARSLATKEELSKLGRVVARLSRGEDVGEGPLDGLTPAASSSTSTAPSAPVAGPSNPAPAPPSAAVPIPGPSKPAESAAKKEDPDSSDEEVDMKGPKQVGGGPLPPAEPALRPPRRDASVESSLSPAPSIPAPLPAALPQRPPPVPAPVRPPPTVPVRPPGSIPSGKGPAQPLKPSLLPASSTGRPPLPVPPQGTFPPGYIPPRPTSIPPPPLIPPKPLYPSLPRFLFVAFKEARTEKYMLPLGKNAYISRVGGDYVTDPPPPIVMPTPAPVPAPTPATVVPNPSAASNAEPPNTASAEPAKRRTRQSLAADSPAPNVEAPKEVEPKIEVEAPPVQEVKKEPPSSNLTPLPGGNPSKGTVLISTFVPVNEWLKPDWATVEKGLPWLNPALMRPKVPEVKAEPPKSPETATPALPETAPGAGTPSSPTRALRHPPRPFQPDPPKKEVKPKVKSDRLLNFGATSFLPDDEEALHPVTIRLEGINDATWRKIKLIMEEVEGYELKYLAEDEPELLTNAAPVPANSVVRSAAPSAPMSVPQPPPLSRTPMLAASRLGFSLPQIDLLRRRLREIRKSTFNNLLARVPARSFLRFRVESTDPSIADALVDKWAPRPYPISTKPLYATNTAGEEDFESVPVYLSPEKPSKRRKGEEETVTFELPVSFDALDEMVEEGARLSMTTGRGRGRGGRGGKVDDGRKRHGKRWTPGAICEGCGLPKKVWRHGPNGRRTLCNGCGDAYTEGTLGPLKAPGAASQNAAGDGEGDQSMEVDEDSKPEINVPATTETAPLTSENSAKTTREDAPSTTTTENPITPALDSSATKGIPPTEEPTASTNDTTSAAPVASEETAQTSPDAPKT